MEYFLRYEEIQHISENNHAIGLRFHFTEHFIHVTACISVDKH